MDIYEAKMAALVVSVSTSVNFSSLPLITFLAEMCRSVASILMALLLSTDKRKSSSGSFGSKSSCVNPGGSSYLAIQMSESAIRS